MPPTTIAEYLVEFDAALEARLGRRRRIVAEVHDHLREAEAAAGQRGLSGVDAQAAAIRDFGDPVWVAQAFGADPVARLTNRLVTAGAELDVWMARHPWGGAVVGAGVPTSLWFLVAMAAALSGAAPMYTADMVMAVFPVLLLFWGVTAWGLRGRPEAELSARAQAVHKEYVFQFQYQWWLGFAGLGFYFALAGRDDGWSLRTWAIGVALVTAAAILLAGVRRLTQRTSHAHEHPWASTLGGYAMPIACAWVVLVAFVDGPPASVRLTVAVVAGTFACASWLYRGSLSTGEARLRFHERLVVAQWTVD